MAVLLNCHWGNGVQSFHIKRDLKLGRDDICCQKRDYRGHPPSGICHQTAFERVIDHCKTKEGHSGGHLQLGTGYDEMWLQFSRKGNTRVQASSLKLHLKEQVTHPLKGQLTRSELSVCSTVTLVRCVKEVEE